MKLEKAVELLRRTIATCQDFSTDIQGPFPFDMNLVAIRTDEMAYRRVHPFGSRWDAADEAPARPHQAQPAPNEQRGDQGAPQRPAAMAPPPTHKGEAPGLIPPAL